MHLVGLSLEQTWKISFLVTFSVIKSIAMGNFEKTLLVLHAS
jgi:hypothetical protein